MGDWEEDNRVHVARDKMKKESRAEAESICTLAGLPPERMWELANGYWPLAPQYDEARRPWWLVQTAIGLIRMGWRKRVMSIEWDATPHRCVVTIDNVTKDDTMVHASSVAKAVEYLTSLRIYAKGS